MLVYIFQQSKMAKIEFFFDSAAYIIPAIS